MSILLPAFVLALSLDALAIRLRDDLALSASVGAITTVVWLFVLAREWERCEADRAELLRIDRSERLARRAVGRLEQVRLPLEAENDQHAPARGRRAA